MDSLVTAFKAFKDEKNKRYILKYLFVLSLNRDVIAHCIIKLPHEYKKLCR